MIKEKITFDTIGDILERESYHDNAKRLYEMARDARFETLQNPGVEISIIYSNHLRTENGVFYKKPTKNRTKDHKIATPKSIFYSLGDGTLLTTSTVFPGLKWADDFNKNMIGAKRVTFVEGCSSFNKKSSLIEEDDNQENSKSAKKKNRYIGMTCSCKHTIFLNMTHRTSCSSMNHANMIGDSGLVRFVSESLATGTESLGIGKQYAKFKESDWIDYLDSCKLFTS